MPQTKTRVVGSGFTTFNYMGQPIAFCDQVQDSGQNPYAQPEAIMPLDSLYPVEIVTPRAVTVGMLTLTIRELWNAPVWHQLVGLEGTNTIVDVYSALAANPAEVTCMMLIKPPGGTVWRGKLYHSCIVTQIDDSENITIGQLSISRQIRVAYTHTTPITTAAQG